MKTDMAERAALHALGISPECGCASHATGHLIAVDDERRKLELLVDTARAIWG